MTLVRLLDLIGIGVFAVSGALAAGRKVGGGNSRQQPARPLSARVYTFVGDDVPEGW